MPHCGRAPMEDTNTGIIEETLSDQIRSPKSKKSSRSKKITKQPKNKRKNMKYTVRVDLEKIFN